MSITHSLAELVQKHVTLEVESIDRLYLNVYIPKLQHASGASWFLKHDRQYPVASSAAMAPISHAFVAAIEAYAQTHHLPVLTFAKGQRKEDVVAPYVARAAGQDGIVLIGKAQEKTTTFRTAKGQGPGHGTAIHGCIAARQWSITTTSTVSTKTLGRSFSNSVRIFLTPPNSASTGMSI